MEHLVPHACGNVYVTDSGADFYPLDIVYDKTEDLTLYPVYALTHNLGAANVTINDNGYHYVNKTSGNASSDRTLRITGGSPSVIIENLETTSNSSEVSPIDISPGAELHLTLWGTNTLEGYNGSSFFGSSNSTAAVRVQAGATLVITEYSTGSLNAKGGDASSFFWLGVLRGFGNRQ